MEKIQQLISEKEKECWLFHPKKMFYETVGINQKRWGQIYRGDIDPTISEAKAIAKYFEIDIIELI